MQRGRCHSTMADIKLADDLLCTVHWEPRAEACVVWCSTRWRQTSSKQQRQCPAGCLLPHEKQGSWSRHWLPDSRVVREDRSSLFRPRSEAASPLFAVAVFLRPCSGQRCSVDWHAVEVITCRKCSTSKQPVCLGQARRLRSHPVLCVHRPCQSQVILHSTLVLCTCVRHQPQKGQRGQRAQGAHDDQRRKPAKVCAGDTERCSKQGAEGATHKPASIQDAHERREQCGFHTLHSTQPDVCCDRL